MTDKTSSHYYKKGLDFYLNDPENGIWFYSNEEQRDKEAVEAIRGYLDPVDGWNEDVADISVGVVTGSAVQVDVVHPIGPIDEDGCDENSEYWGDGFEYKCGYAIKPVTPDTLVIGESLIKWTESDYSDKYIKGSVGKVTFFDLIDELDCESGIVILRFNYGREDRFDSIELAKNEAEKQFEKFLADCGLQSKFRVISEVLE